jgi:alpha-N-arabinofuranosidase
MRPQSRRRRVPRRSFAPQSVEVLEARALLATVTVNASQVVRPVNTQLLGVNVAWWDTNLNTTRTQSMVAAAGLTLFRFPGGSSSDTFHFNAAPTYNGEGTVASMAQFIASVHGQGIVTLDYGSGSPQEAAALLAYLNAPTTSNVNIGYGEQWSTSSNSWVQVNWQTSGYWAALRAATPITPDDGLNFLRIDHPAPFGFTYFEVGNEEYGSWEIDYHGQGGDTGKPHDPATYVAFAEKFASYAAQIDPSIAIGYDVGDPYAYNNWAGNLLQISASQGFMPGFLSDHNYVQAPGSESDLYLLQDTFSDPGSIDDWATRGADYESLLTQDYGSDGANVQLLATEYNSVYSNPGKQTTSLVNGLSVADGLGILLNSPYDGANVWDLRNGWDTSNNNSSSLYGWRQGGDYGLIGSPNGSPPSSGTYVPYPTYFAEQLGSNIIQSGGTVVQASSSDPNLAAYAVLEPDGHLDLLVINKSVSGSLSGTFQLTGFTPSTSAQFWRYGEAQDTAQSKTTNGHAALAHATITLKLSGSTFTLFLPAYSMTVLDLSPSTGTAAAPRAPWNPSQSSEGGIPIIRTTAAATNPPVPSAVAKSSSATHRQPPPPTARRSPVFDQIRQRASSWTLHSW